MANPSISTPARDLVTLHYNIQRDLAALMALVASAPLALPELEACAQHLETAAIAIRDSKYVVARHMVA